jgi:outer membrane protein
MKPLLLSLVATLSLWGLTLDEAIETGREQSPLIQQAQGKKSFAKHRERQAEAAFLPTLDAGFNWSDTDHTTSFGFSPNYHYGVIASYNLFKGFADLGNLDARSADSRASQFKLIAVQQDVRLNVIRAYVEFLKAVKLVETQRKNLESLQRSYTDTEARYEQGMLAKNDVLLIEVEKLRAEQQVVAANGEEVRARLALENIMGMVLNQNEVIQDFNPAVTALAPFDELLKQCYTLRSEIKAIEQELAALQGEFVVAAGTYYPQVDLSADYRRNDQERVSNGMVVQVEDQATAMVNVTWNLYSGGKDEAKLKEVMDLSSVKEAELVGLKNELRYQLGHAMEQYYVAKSAKEVATRAYESAQENFRITKDRYDYGQTDALTLLKAQSDLTGANNAYNNSFYDLYVAKATVDRIAGE